jgi:hypothetical protein
VLSPVVDVHPLLGLVDSSVITLIINMFQVARTGCAQ